MTQIIRQLAGACWGELVALSVLLSVERPRSSSKKTWQSEVSVFGQKVATNFWISQDRGNFCVNPMKSSSMKLLSFRWN